MALLGLDVVCCSRSPVGKQPNGAARALQVIKRSSLKKQAKNSRLKVCALAPWSLLLAAWSTRRLHASLALLTSILFMAACYQCRQVCKICLGPAPQQRLAQTHGEQMAHVLGWCSSCC